MIATEIAKKPVHDVIRTLGTSNQAIYFNQPPKYLLLFVYPFRYINNNVEVEEQAPKTCGLDDVFPPDDLWSRPEALCYIYIYIYIYIYLHFLYEFCFLWFTNCVLLSADDNSLIPGCLWLLAFVLNNTLLLGIWCSTIPPRMFLSLDLLSEYRIKHGGIGPLYVTSGYSTWIFCRGVSGFATDCPCDVWCRGLTTCLLHVGPSFGKQQLGYRFDIMYIFIFLYFCMQLYMSWYIISSFGFIFTS